MVTWNSEREAARERRMNEQESETTAEQANDEAEDAEEKALRLHRIRLEADATKISRCMEMISKLERQEEGDKRGGPSPRGEYWEQATASTASRNEESASNQPTSRDPTENKDGRPEESSCDWDGDPTDEEPPRERTPSPSIPSTPQQPQKETYRCGTCNKQVEERERYVTCTRCKRRVHVTRCTCPCKLRCVGCCTAHPPDGRSRWFCKQDPGETGRGNMPPSTPRASTRPEPLDAKFHQFRGPLMPLSHKYLILSHHSLTIISPLSHHHLTSISPSSHIYIYI